MYYIVLRKDHLASWLFQEITTKVAGCSKKYHTGIVKASMR